MKITLQPTQFTFSPGSNVVDFSPMVGAFQPERLLAVINTTTGKLVYAAASDVAGYGGTFTTSSYTNDTLVYDSSNAGQNPSDILQVLYDSETVPQNISASDGTQVLTTTDAMSLQEGLNVNLLNSSFGGQLGNPIPLPNNNNALSMAFLNGSVLAAPRMDPVTNELIVQSSPAPLQAVDLTSVDGAPIALGSAAMAQSLPVVIANDQTAIPITTASPLEVTVGQTVSQDILGVAVGGNRNNQIEISFNSAPGATLITNSFTGSGAATVSNGHTIYSTGTTAVSSASGISVQTTTYRPAHEIYAAFTAAFLNPTATTEHRIGLFDNSDGFFIGYSGLNFGVTVRNTASDAFTVRGSFNVDTLTGGASSKFTRNGVPEPINFAVSNLFRIRFAWLGSANIFFEVFSPDAQWVLFHNIRQPNTSYNPSIQNPNLPMRVQVIKTSGATNASIATACWGAGTTSAYSPITATLNDNTLAALTRSVITGVTTGGGGGYVNVKVNPSGALVTDATGSAVSVTGPLPVTTENYITGQQATNATSASTVAGAGTNLLNAAGGTASIDATGYRTVTVQAICNSSAAVINFEHSNDNINYQNFGAYRLDNVTSTINNVYGNITPGNGTAFVYTFPVMARYVRLRLNTAPGVGQTLQCFTRFSQMAWTPPHLNVINNTAANLNANVSGSVTVIQPTPANLNVTALVAGATLSSSNTIDIAGTAITASLTSGNIVTANTQAASFMVNVTALNAGTLLDVEVQETMENSGFVTYYTIYTFERISAVGQYYSPPIKLSGSGLRYIRTVSGGGVPSNSITPQVVRVSRSGQAETVKRFVNRTIVPNTLNSTTGSFFCDGVEDFNLIVRCTAQTTPATIALEFSTDGTNWFTSTATVTTVVGVAHANIENMQFKFVRAIVTAAGTGITLGEVTIGGHSA